MIFLFLLNISLNFLSANSEAPNEMPLNSDAPRRVVMLMQAFFGYALLLFAELNIVS